MSFDQMLSIVAVYVLLASFLIWRHAAGRLPMMKPSGLSPVLSTEYGLLAKCRWPILIGAIASCFMHLPFWLYMNDGVSIGDWSVVWKCLSVSSGVIFIVAVAFHESVRSFNRMRQ